MALANKTIPVRMIGMDVAYQQIMDTLVLGYDQLVLLPIMDNYVFDMLTSIANKHVHIICASPFKQQFFFSRSN